MRPIRSLLARWRRHDRAARTGVARRVDLRVGADLFAIVRAHVEDFTCGEEAGFLVCSLSRLADRDVLLAREWLPVPGAAIERNARGSVLSWSEAFNSHALERALELDGTPVLVHSHGHPNPTFSSDDRRKERPLFGAFSRLLATLPTGTIVLGDHDAIGSFWVNGANTMELGKIEIAGQPLEVWWPPDALPAPRPPRLPLARQSLRSGDLHRQHPRARCLAYS